MLARVALGSRRAALFGRTAKAKEAVAANLAEHEE
jgi:hypothetical protein